jgi:hypothetical protein
MGDEVKVKDKDEDKGGCVCKILPVQDFFNPNSGYFVIKSWVCPLLHIQ